MVLIIFTTIGSKLYLLFLLRGVSLNEHNIIDSVIINPLLHNYTYGKCYTITVLNVIIFVVVAVVIFVFVVVISRRRHIVQATITIHITF